MHIPATILSVLTIVLVYVNSAAGAGLSISEQSVTGLGNAYAGGAAAAEDASTISFNPAGLSLLAGSEAIAGLHVVLPSAKFHNSGSTHLSGQPLTGGEGGDAGGILTIPNFYYSHRLNDRLSLGIGVNSPFGLSTNYDASWVGRYYAVNSELVTVNINPCLAWQVNDRLSLGAGFDAQYARAELSNAIDFGTIFGALGVPGASPQGNDGFVTLRGDSWSWGYNVGALYRFSATTRAGIAYRSHIDQTLTGEATYTGVPALNPTGRFVNTGIRADVTFPDSASIGVHHDLSPQLTAMADVTWTHWSTIDQLRIRFDNPAEADAVTTLRWKDTFRYAVGALYKPGAWSVRGGAAYDQSPARDTAQSSPRVPDSDRIWLTAGLGYRFNQHLAINGAYAHLFFRKGEIRKVASGEDQFRGALNGSYDSSVDIVSAELRWTF